MNSNKVGLYYQTALPNKSLSNVSEQEVLNKEVDHQSILNVLNRIEIKLDVLLMIQNQGRN